MEYFIVIFLVLLSALFSGLTLGFFSLNREDVARKAELGDKQAKKVYKIRRNGNQLLCTLLIGNVAVNSALSIFLVSIASGFTAGLIATALIVIFGEIIPQAAFSRYALILGSNLAWLVSFFMFILYPVCKPMAMALDKILGDEVPTVYSKHELIKIIEQHEESQHSKVDEDEERIIKGALSFSEKTVKEIMTPRVEVFSIDSDQPLNKATIKKIYDAGHSRIPVHKKNKDNIIGVLYVKDLIGNDISSKNVGDLARPHVYFVDFDKTLDKALTAFKKEKHHLFVVLNEFGGMAGIVTIEDIIEEIIGDEIMDEYDKYEDLQKRARDKLKRKKIQKV